MQIQKMTRKEGEQDYLKILLIGEDGGAVSEIMCAFFLGCAWASGFRAAAASPQEK
jgi:hypothetical protein